MTLTRSTPVLLDYDACAAWGIGWADLSPPLQAKNPSFKDLTTTPLHLHEPAAANVLNVLTFEEGTILRSQYLKHYSNDRSTTDQFENSQPEAQLSALMSFKQQFSPGT